MAKYVLVWSSFPRYHLSSFERWMLLDWLLLLCKRFIWRITRMFGCYDILLWKWRS